MNPRLVHISILWLVAIGCSKQPALVGRWSDASGSTRVEFFADGTAAIGTAPALAAEYGWIEDGRIKFMVSALGGSQVIVWQVVFEGETMRAVLPSGDVTILERVLGDWPPTDGDRLVRTIADIRNVGTALFSWLTDEITEGKPGTDRRLANKGLPPVISLEELNELLAGQYLMSEVPGTDGWGHPYEYRLDRENLLAKFVVAIRSPGRDGIFSSGFPDEPSTFPTWDVDQDIVWRDGFFVRYPQ